MTGRILIVHNSADLYGASRSLLRLARRLDRSRFELLVMLPEEGPLKPRLEESGVRVLVFPKLRVITRSMVRSPEILPWLGGFLPSCVRMAKILKAEQIRIVHTNTGVICSPALAAAIAGIPHVWHIRDWFQEFGALWKPYSRYILRFSRRVLCVSQPIAGQFPPSDKVTVLHNGIDLTEFPPFTRDERASARAKWGFQPSDIVVCTVGRIKFHRKGQEYLIEAVSLLRKKGTELRILLAGGSPPGAEDQLPKMEALAGRLGVHAVFAGELSDSRPAYAAADIFVLPSAQPEPFGGVVMEAMSLGLPVVGTSIGGTVEQIDDGKTGFLVPPADPQAIASKLEMLAQDEKLRAQMGEAARRRVGETFRLEQTVNHLQNTYGGLTQ